MARGASYRLGAGGRKGTRWCVRPFAVACLRASVSRVVPRLASLGLCEWNVVRAGAWHLHATHGHTRVPEH